MSKDRMSSKADFRLVRAHLRPEKPRLCLRGLIQCLNGLFWNPRGLNQGSLFRCPTPALLTLMMADFESETAVLVSLIKFMLWVINSSPKAVSGQWYSCPAWVVCDFHCVLLEIYPLRLLFKKRKKKGGCFLLIFVPNKQFSSVTMK